MRPWGIIHRGCCGFKTRVKVERRYENFPVSDDSINGLKERVRELEKFRHILEINVVDTSLLEDAQSNEQQQ